ncbi:hypothetical protein ACNOYE_03385 [Nannocystaceae bacterium ST9]
MTEPLSQSEAIARELEALGEAPLSADELAMLAMQAGALLDDQPAVASTARLIELSQASEPIELSELGKQRAWRTFEQRRAPAPAPAGRPTRWAPWVAVSLAIAAAALIVVLVPGGDESAGGLDAQQVAEVGEQARSALRLLDDGLSDTARAERQSAEYRRRLEGH